MNELLITYNRIAKLDIPKKIGGDQPSQTHAKKNFRGVYKAEKCPCPGQCHRVTFSNTRVSNTKDVFAQNISFPVIELLLSVLHRFIRYLILGSKYSLVCDYNSAPLNRDSEGTLKYFMSL